MTDRGEQPLVSVIVPARDAAATIGSTLEALAAQELEGEFEVIVVDDGSSDGTGELAERWGSPVRVVRNEASEGAGAARNRGVAMSRAPVLAFTDADCFPMPAWLSRGLAAIERADLVQGSVEPDPAAERGPFDRTLIVRSEDGYYQTANLFVRRDLFESLGGFEDWILERERPARRPMGEDVLFAWQARRAGARVVFVPEALAHHAVLPATLAESLRDRWRWARNMPGLARRIPELREQTFFRRWFLNRRTAGFDLAALSLLVAILTRRRLALVGALPYARWILGSAKDWDDQRALPVVVGSVAGDAVTLAALLAGSVRWRTPLI